MTNKQTQQAAADFAHQDSLLEQAIAVTKHTERDHAEMLLKTLTEQAMDGVVSWDKSLAKTVDNAIKKIDAIVAKQVKEIQHDADLLKLEGSWRGLHYLVSNSDVGKDVKVRVLPASKKELHKDLSKAMDFDQSQTFKKIYEDEFGTPGGEPYGVLVGDYEFANNPKDIEFLTKMSDVAAASFAPFVTSAGSQLLGFDTWKDVSRPKDLEKMTMGPEYANYRNFRDTDAARFIVLTMPRTLARLPYDKESNPAEDLDYEEIERNAAGKALDLPHEQYCWMSSAWVMGAKMTEAFSKYSFCTAIRGVEGGGKVTGLPSYSFTSDDGDVDLKCPTEVGITDRREAELSKLGMLPLCHFRNTDYAVFFGAQTANQPKNYEDAGANEDAAISARLPYTMLTARFAHYVKAIGRDKIGSYETKGDLQRDLRNWLTRYVSPGKMEGDMLYRFPLSAVDVEVAEIPGSAGAYNAIIQLKPWLQTEALSTSLRMVARLDNVSGDGA